MRGQSWGLPVRCQLHQLADRFLVPPAVSKGPALFGGWLDIMPPRGAGPPPCFTEALASRRCLSAGTRAGTRHGRAVERRASSPLRSVGAGRPRQARGRGCIRPGSQDVRRPVMRLQGQASPQLHTHTTSRPRCTQRGDQHRPCCVHGCCIVPHSYCSGVLLHVKHMLMECG
jgi:hypothetical protein